MPRQQTDITSQIGYSQFPGRIIVLLMILLGIFFHRAGAQHSIGQSGEIEIEPTGALWLEGKASIVDYRCYADKLDGAGIIGNTADPTQSIRGEGEVDIKVTIPVKALQCGKRKMNQDMYEALKADKYPEISYLLLEAKLLHEGTNGVHASGTWMKIRARGLLTIAGVTDTTDFLVAGQLVGENRFRVKGSKQLNMHDFNIEPPTALLGLIKANEKLTVHFDVSVHLK